MNETAKPRRRWFRYTVPPLLLLMILVSIGVASFAVTRQQSKGDARSSEILAICEVIRQGKAVPLAGVEATLGSPNRTDIMSERSERRLYAHKGDRLYLVVFFDRISHNATYATVVSPYGYSTPK